jgi:hypothetical protein
VGAAMLLIGVDWSLALHAGKIAEDHALRGYDAVHLAHGTRLKRFSLLETYMTSANQPIGLMPRTRPRWVALGRSR